MQAYEKISVPVESINSVQVSTGTSTNIKTSFESIQGKTSASTSTETSLPVSKLNDLDHDPFGTSPVKVQVVRSYNYLGVSDKLRSFPPVHPNSIQANEDVKEVMKAFMDHYKPKHASETSEATVSPVTIISHNNAARTASRDIDSVSTTTYVPYTEDDDTAAFTVIPAGTPTHGHEKSDSIDFIFTMYLRMSDDELSFRDRSTTFSPLFDEAGITSSTQHDSTTEEGFAVITTPEANEISPETSTASEDHASSNNDSFTTSHDSTIEDSPAYSLPAFMTFTSIDTAPLGLSLPIPTFPEESYYASSSAMSIPDIIVTPNHSIDSADHFTIRKALTDNKNASSKDAFVVVPSALFENNERKYSLPSIQRFRTAQQSIRNYRHTEKVPPRFTAASQRYRRNSNNGGKERSDKEPQDTIETPALNAKPRLSLASSLERDFKPVRQSSKSYKVNRMTPVKSSQASDLPRRFVLADRFSLGF